MMCTPDALNDSKKIKDNSKAGFSSAKKLILALDCILCQRKVEHQMMQSKDQIHEKIVFVDTSAHMFDGLKI